VPNIWGLIDDRTGHTGQVLGVITRLGIPYTLKRLDYNRLAALPSFLVGGSLIALDRARSAPLNPPYPDYASKTNCSLDGLAPDNGLPVKIIIEEAGSGAGAKCGQAIFLELSIWNDKGSIAYTDSFPIVLGTRTLAAGLDFALLGITKGEARSVIIPPYALVRAKTSDAPAAAQKALGSQRIAYVRVKRLD
jgi:hypothetical protein